MPNCDFYAIPEDHRGILDWLLADGSCDLYELASDFEKPLRQFRSSEEVLQQFDRCHWSGERRTVVDLQLYVRGAGPPFVPKRIELNPKSCNSATYRYSAEGWGLIQLYLESLNLGTLEASHTNHFTLKGAKSWDTINTEKGPAEAWDFVRINSFSSKLNREIRKRGVAKVASRVILPGALKMWDEGIALSPWKPGEHQIERRS